MEIKTENQLVIDKYKNSKNNINIELDNVRSELKNLKQNFEELKKQKEIIQNQLFVSNKTNKQLQEKLEFAENDVLYYSKSRDIFKKKNIELEKKINS